MYELIYSKRAQKDTSKLKQAGLQEKTMELLKILKENPWKNPPSYEKLLGDLKGFYSRRINLQHRLVYEVFEEQKTVKILKMWTHYE